MKINVLFLIVALIIPAREYAQTPVNKSITVQPGQKIAMRFDYPNLIRVSTWDKNEISIQGSASINSGENDDAFKLETSTEGNTISIRNEIVNMKGIPHRFTIYDGAQKIIFKSQEEMHKYQNEKGHGKFDRMTSGIDMDIYLDIKVPRNMDTRIESVYGIVEIKTFTGPLTVSSTYGAVDAALTESTTGELIAETNYGDIYTNLNIKFGGEPSRQEDFHTYVSAKPGNGPRYSFESKYGNVYLRKATQ
ncbi:MAG TPA: hypothetical protein VIN08_00100 [Ohtaekwangia sp.]|uniref:hypothetical protein n=1 Tax=Ohtaekwangia sp. TaxID=2066019 RepID=UPI002F940D6D